MDVWRAAAEERAEQQARVHRGRRVQALATCSTTITDLSAETAQRSAAETDGAPAHLTQGGGGHLDRATNNTKSRSLFSFFLSRPFPSLATALLPPTSKSDRKGESAEVCLHDVITEGLVIGTAGAAAAVRWRAAASGGRLHHNCC